jgi:GGDEF domain-containing protein
MSTHSGPPSPSPSISARHVLWVAEAALGRLRRTIPSGGLIDDGDGFVFLIEDARELEQMVSELTSSAAYGVARVGRETAGILVEAVAAARREGRQKLRRGPDRTPRMAAISMPAVIVPQSITGEEARRRFLDDETLTTLVYADEARRPSAALGRERLFRMFSSQYGHAVFASRPVVEAADTDPHLIDGDLTILDGATGVSNRAGESAFDDVVVVDPAGRVTGVVCVRDLLKALTGLGLENLQQLNPLTGLPGPTRTEQALEEMLDMAEPLVVSRIDIADFKRFNERAGFTIGDRTIQALGHAVADVARSRGVRFIGHVGGDDFIVAWNDESEALVGAVEVAHALLAAVPNLGQLPPGVSGPDLAVSTLVVRAGEIRDATLLAERLAALKDEVRRYGGPVHGVARLETIAEPAWRSLAPSYVAVAGPVASLLGAG